MITKAPRIHRLDLVRVTEAAALTAARWMGVGQAAKADRAAARTMHQVLNLAAMDGRIVVSEARRLGEEVPDDAGTRVGTGEGPEVDVVVDPIDGRNLLARGAPGAISALAVAPRGSIWAPEPAVYMEKLVVNHEAADVLVEDCLDAPAGWTLALIARAKGKPVDDLVVFVLDRPRHQDLIDEIRSAGARVMLRRDGDIGGAVTAALRKGHADVLMGVGGVTEGVLAACAVQMLGGSMLGRLAPQSSEEKAAVAEAGLDTQRIMRCHEIVQSGEVSFVATGIMRGPLLEGVRFFGPRAESQSMTLSGETGTARFIRSEHLILPPHVPRSLDLAVTPQP